MPGIGLHDLPAKLLCLGKRTSLLKLPNPRQHFRDRGHVNTFRRNSGEFRVTLTETAAIAVQPTAAILRDSCLQVTV